TWQISDGLLTNVLPLPTTTVTLDAAPLLDLDTGTSPGNDFDTTFQEEAAIVLGSGPVPIAALGAVSLTDDDNATLASVTIDLTNAKAGDVLSYIGSVLGIVLDPSSTATHIVLTGAASPDDYAAAIQSVTFENTTENPDTANRTITVVANDGIANGNTATAT